MPATVSSVRADAASATLLVALARGGARSLTIAPEAGTERLRSEISAVGQAIANTRRASDIIATTEGALDELRIGLCRRLTASDMAVAAGEVKADL